MASQTLLSIFGSNWRAENLIFLFARNILENLLLDRPVKVQTLSHSQAQAGSSRVDNVGKKNTPKACQKCKPAVKANKALRMKYALMQRDIPRAVAMWIFSVIFPGDNNGKSHKKPSVRKGCTIPWK